MKDQPPSAPLTAAQRQRVADEGDFARRMIARFTRMYRGLLSEEDITQWVQVGVTEAARTYREELGTPFGHFAYKRVTGLIVEAAKQETRERRLARQAAEACMAGQIDPAGPMDSEEETTSQLHQLSNRVVAAMLLAAEGSAAMAAGEDEVADRQARTVVTQRLHEAMRALPDHERQVLQRHYFEEQELKAVARALNIGYATARRHHNSALDALAASVEAA